MVTDLAIVSAQQPFSTVRDERSHPGTGARHDGDTAGAGLQGGDAERLAMSRGHEHGRLSSSPRISLR